MTECFDDAMNPSVGEKRLGSIGRPSPGTELRLRDRAGAEPALGEPGEIVVRSPDTMLGYWDDKAHTAEVLRDGWLRTGDIAGCDEDGWYWFVGRSKQLIIRGGSHIAPGEVEAALHEHPAVREAVVVGVPDPPLGERVAAWVAPLDGCDVGAGELERFVGERIAAYKVPEWIWIDRALPTTSIGQLDRVTLERWAAERVAEPGA